MNYEEVFRDAVRSEIKRREGTVTRFAEVDYVVEHDFINEDECFVLHDVNCRKEVRIPYKYEKVRGDVYLLIVANARCIRQYDVYRIIPHERAIVRQTGTMNIYEFNWSAADESKLINATICRLTGTYGWEPFYFDEESDEEKELADADVYLRNEERKWNKFDLDEECDEETEKRLRESIREVFEKATRNNDELHERWKESCFRNYCFGSESIRDVVEKLKEILAFSQENDASLNATIVGRKFVRRYVGSSSRYEADVETKTLRIDGKTPLQVLENISVKGEWFSLTTEEVDVEWEKYIEWLVGIMKETPSGDLKLTAKLRLELRVPENPQRRRNNHETWEASFEELRKLNDPLLNERQWLFDRRYDQLEDAPYRKRANKECRKLVRVFSLRKDATVCVQRKTFTSQGCVAEYEFCEKFPQGDAQKIEEFASTLRFERASDALYHGAREATTRKIMKPPVNQRTKIVHRRRYKKKKCVFRNMTRVLRLRIARCGRAFTERLSDLTRLDKRNSNENETLRGVERRR